MQHDLRVRKHPRLKSHDYSQNGYYYITICTQGKLPALSRVVGQGLAPAAVALTPMGKIIEEQLLYLPNRYPFVEIDKYVIMPNHIHAIIIFGDEANQTAGASPRPTLMNVVGAFKSLSTRLCNQSDNMQGRKIWQASFYEQVIRDKEGYQSARQYIDENPAKWVEDCYYTP